MTVKEIFGCAAFGLDDQALQVEGEAEDTSFELANAVLPAHLSGKILTGINAKQERTHSGLSWPPAARVNRKEYLRRVPIPCVWRGFVEAGDRTARWRVGGGVSFAFSRILSEHLSDLLISSKCSPNDMAVIAIPDALDEFGQEALLRDLKRQNFDNIQLLWRPVAIALSWLSGLNQNNAFAEDTGQKEHIIVVYVGPDAVEMTTFRLHRQEHKNALFVIPVRERPRYESIVPGFDWAANILEKVWPSMDDGAFWQAFTKFPDIWNAISGRPFLKDRDVWSLEDRWTFWTPDNILEECKKNVSAEPNIRLRSLLAYSAPIFEAGTEKDDGFVEESLANLFSHVMDLCPESRLRGVIVAGSLCPQTLPQWIQSSAHELKDRGIKTEAESNSPKLDAIWLSRKKDAIVDGCVKYGRRLDLNQPTYLDTLPQLSLLAEQGGEHVWVDLLNAETCEGGKPYKPEPIEGRFAIQAEATDLKVYLKKGDVRGRADLETPEVQSSKMSTNDQSIIEAKVRQAGTYEKTLKLFPDKEAAEGRYARKLARELFGNPFRQAKFAFPSVPEKQMPVNVSLEIRPASGLARITLVPSKPEDQAFLLGRPIFLDYSTMEETEPPPPPARGWPEVTKLNVDHAASFLHVFKYDINNYLKTLPNSFTFMSAVEGLKSAITSLTNIPTDDGFDHLRAIDQDGIAGTKEATQQIDFLAEKVKTDFMAIPKDHERKFVTRVSWLFAKTPENVKQKIITYISQGYYDENWNYGVEAAGRVFIEEEDLRLLYSKIYERINSAHTNPFPIQSSRAIWRSLCLRANSPRAMNRIHAKAFTEEAVKKLEMESNKGKKGKFDRSFFQAARLFLFLLRFRTMDHSFLDPDNPMDSDLFERTLKCLQAAENHFSNSKASVAVKAKELVLGIEKFMRYEGSNDILKKLEDFAGSD